MKFFRCQNESDNPVSCLVYLIRISPNSASRNFVESSFDLLSLRKKKDLCPLVHLKELKDSLMSERQVSGKIKGQPDRLHSWKPFLAAFLRIFFSHSSVFAYSFGHNLVVVVIFLDLTNYLYVQIFQSIETILFFKKSYFQFTSPLLCLPTDSLTATLRKKRIRTWNNTK